MDQNELRELENRCIQEQPPECKAACPLHVDARTFVGHMTSGNSGAAIVVLRKTMPLAGILGRICDAPCQARCKRGQAGDPIRIGALERACISQTDPGYKVVPLPGRGKNVVVIGSGLSSLTAAWDLIRKGYGVTLFEPQDRLGGPLLDLDPALLPAEIVAAETALLTRLGVEVRFNNDLNIPDFFTRLLKEFDAAYLGLDGVTDAGWKIPREKDGRILITPGIQATGIERLFGGGLFQAGQKPSYVLMAAHGRWGAVSIDRLLQKVSLTAGREGEGPQPTRLFTNIEGIEALPAIPMADPVKGYTPQEAAKEAERCLQCECLECVKVCVYLAHYGSYPKKYARRIYNNESIVMGSRDANKLINSCSLCGLCETVCPEDFAMQDLCLEARRSMVRRNKMPPSAHEFALLDMEFSNGERFFMARHQPGRSASTQVFFPGCQLCASEPDQVGLLYDYLGQKLDGGVALFLGCCGAPALWAGQEALYDAQRVLLQKTWEKLGRPRLIPACSTCYKTFKENMPQADIRSLWEVLETCGLPETIRTEGRNGPLTLHDPCTTRREPALQQSVRRLLEQKGVAIDEPVLGREKTECCGFGGLMQNANPQLAHEVAKRCAGVSDNDFITYCAMCRDNLARTGKRISHILDLMFPVNGADPAERKAPGLSQRQENRARLKETLSTKLWREKTREMAEYEKIKLRIPDDVQRILEERRILVKDLQKVIDHAEKSGERLFHEASGRFRASFKPIRVTFWVEYSPNDDGFTVHNAYSHRMSVVSEGAA